MGQISNERQKIDVQNILLILEKITNEKPLSEQPHYRFSTILV